MDTGSRPAMTSSIFYRNISADHALNCRAPKKEHFHEARESLLGVWQAGNRRERIVLMVRATKDMVLGRPFGDIESRSAFDDRVPGQAWANPANVNLALVYRATGA
jgi:hypothetical protein